MTSHELPLNLSGALFALDSAVASAREELLPPKDCADPKVAAQLERELKELCKLASGGLPDWGSRETAVLYSSWYQLGHVNLAYNVAGFLLAKWSIRNSRDKVLHVVDFGAGTFALPVAFELLRAREQLPGDIVLHLIEASAVMLEHGQRIFQNLRDCLGSKASTTSHAFTGHGEVVTVPEGKSAFCLMHAVYQENDDLKHRLSRFISRRRPFYGVATCYCKKLHLLKDVEAHCLSEGFECTDVLLKDIPDVCRTPLRKTQQYRKALLHYGKEHFRDRHRVEQLLTREVPLWPWGPAMREYVSKT